MGQSQGPDDFNAPPWGGPPSSDQNMNNARPMDPLVGTTVLGSYHIMARLGSGGIGTVYKGRHLGTGRIVAIKTLKGYLLTDPVVVKRFEREAIGLSKLQHQNIVAALDCLMSPQGQPFFIMEYLEGITLARYIKEEGALDSEDARPICLQLCDALSHVHRHGLLHRDLKPENVILMPQNDGSVLAKVVDFGLAQIKDNIQRVTVDGTVVGSPVYMSPEQCMGREPDHRSDLYSLGIIMYETMVGRPPFVGNPMDIMKAHVSEPPPTFASVRPFLEVPKEIERVVFKALEKHPDDRYESAKEFRHAIEFWVAPTSARNSQSHSHTASHSAAGHKSGGHKSGRDHGSGPHSSPTSALNRTQELGRDARRARQGRVIDKKKLAISIVAGLCAIVFCNFALVMLVQYMKPSSTGGGHGADLAMLPVVGPDLLSINSAGELISLQQQEAPAATVPPLQGAAPQGEAAQGEAASQGKTDPKGSSKGAIVQDGSTTSSAAGAAKPLKGAQNAAASKKSDEVSGTATASQGSTDLQAPEVDPGSIEGSTSDTASGEAEQPTKRKGLNTKEAYVAVDSIGVKADGTRFELPLSAFPPEDLMPKKPRKAQTKITSTAKGSKPAQAKPERVDGAPTRPQSSPAQQKPVKNTQRGSAIKPPVQKVQKATGTNSNKTALAQGNESGRSNSKLFGQKLPGNVYGDWKYLEKIRTNRRAENSTAENSP